MVFDCDNPYDVVQIFGKDDLAAILKFGAEDLFTEDEARTEQKQDQVLREDLETILERAEVALSCLTSSHL